MSELVSFFYLHVCHLHVHPNVRPCSCEEKILRGIYLSMRGVRMHIYLSSFVWFGLVWFSFPFLGSVLLGWTDFFVRVGKGWNPATLGVVIIVCCSFRAATTYGW